MGHETLAARLQRLILASLLPVFGIAVLFFVLIIELADVSPQLYRYVSSGVGPDVVARIILLYLPTCVVFAVPLALLFSVAYTLGSYYARNELVAMFGAGVSLRRLIAPLVGVGCLLSVGLFLFDDAVAIDTLRKKNQLHRTALGIQLRLDNFDVTVTSATGRIVYHAARYDDEAQELTDVVVVERDADGGIVQRIDAERGRWDGDRWQFEDLRLFRWQDTPAGRVMVEEQMASLSLAGVGDGPATFRRGNREVSEMRYLDAMDWVATLRGAGRDYRAPLTKAYGKIGFAVTPLAVCLIAATVGGLLRRNIMLMSLLLSLGIAVVFYVLRLAGEILAENGLVSPEVGAFAGVLLFLLTGVLLLQMART